MKDRTFPDAPAAVVVWLDAYANADDEADLSAPKDFGSSIRGEDIGWLVRIGPDKNGKPVVAMGVTRWQGLKRVGHSNAIPLDLVESVKSPDGTVVYYERVAKPRKRVAKPRDEKQGGA